MTDTVNEVQVEFSANVSDLITQLKKLSGYIDETVNNLDNMETASDKLSDSEENLANKAGKASVGHKELNDDLANTANQTEKTSKNTDKYTSCIDNLKSETEELRSTFSKVAEVLGVFGISIGITELIGQVKQLGEEAKTAYTEMQKLSQKSSYKYGLTETQQELVSTMSTRTAIDYSISQDTANQIYGALLNVYPELEKDTEQLEKLASTFASVSAIEGLTDMSSFMTNTFTTAAKYDVKSGDEIIDFITKLEAAAKLSAGMGGSAQEFLNIIKDADMGAQYMGMTLEDTIAYLGSFYKAGNGEDAATMMSSMESYVTKLWATVIKEMEAEGVDTSKLGTIDMQKWWDAILEGIPDTIDETEIYNYFVNQGLRDTSALDIAKGIASAGGTEQFKALMEDTITELYQGSLSEYRSSTRTGEDYQVSQQVSSSVDKANVWSGLGDYFTHWDEYKSMESETTRLMNEILREYGTLSDEYSYFMNQQVRMETGDYDETVENYNNFIKEARELLDKQSNLQPQQVQVQVNVTTDTSYVKANANAKVLTGNATSITGGG